MLVYRDGSESVDPRVLLSDIGRRLSRALDHDAAVDCVIAFGEVEAALADALFPTADGLAPEAQRWRAVSVSLGCLLRATWRGAQEDVRAAAAREAAGGLDAILRSHLPSRVERRVAEGYAWYALYPETYLEAAEALAASSAGPVLCVGIRSIGAGLSGVAAAPFAAAGRTVDAITLRPRGHPFERRPALAPALEAFLVERRDRMVLVVDEGPGLSGSSFCGTAACLAALGFPEQRIVLVPSALPDPAGFVSAEARERWPRHPKAHAGFEDAWLPRGRLGAGLKDLGGGLWRNHVPIDGPPPAVQFQHERRKYLARRDGRTVLLRFAGLGRYGTPRLARAGRLAAAGLGPAPRGLSDGFLALDWIDGTPCPRGALNDGLARAALDHVAHLGCHERTGAPVRAAELRALLETNVGEGLGAAWLDPLRAALDRHLARLDGIEAVAVDGRMLPHEWLRTEGGFSGGFVKADALDHHDDHFYPGTQDIGWDLAGLGVEFGLKPVAIREMAEALAARLRDPALPARLPVQEAAYAAFRLGYAQLAAASLAGSEDGQRFGRLAARYRRLLRRAVLRLAAG
ncbi:hypothetical protein [Arenibaculum pallidiluteum]|uniref:hypothetical protein n=1 Tax=Arenibaculum pallidiluteum TaxID=2812559 RepID=UPI001A961395|nr:hypothetical protein [Arenibaculum pallidiluteum]